MVQQNSVIFAKRMIEIDESLREIASLDELYTELVGDVPSDERERSMKLEEARFAKERMLRLSLHVKNLLGTVEPEEVVR